MKRCPECRQSFEDLLTHCPQDGAELVEPPPSKDPFIGRILGGRYEIMDLLGRGGFGVVYKALDRKMDDVVALKVFDRRRFTDEEAHQAIQRFRREGVLLRRLGKRTNNIVIVYDFEEDDSEELIYFTMDYVDGTTLTSILAEEGALHLPRVLDLGLQLCQALKTAHAEGIVHRDLKLENIMITREGDREIVKVLDFGIAKMVGSQSLTNLAVGVPGTAGFAPPEQLQRPQDIDHRTDLFATGVVLYGLVTGHGPWSGEPIAEPTSSEKVWDLIRSSLEEAPIPFKRWDVDIPRRLENLILKLLEKDQAKRLDSAEILESELKEVRRSLLGESDTEKGFGPAGALGAAANRLGVPPAVFGGGLLVLAIAAVATLWFVLGSTPTVPLPQFLAAAHTGRVLEARIGGEYLEAVVRGEDGEVGDVRVDLHEVGVQELAGEIRDSGVPHRVSGQSLLRDQALEAGTGSPASGTHLSLAGPDAKCSPCAPGAEVRLESGWYTAETTGEEWILTALALQDERGVYRDEELALDGASFFLPSGASLAMVSTFAPTEVRSLLTRAGDALSQGDLRESLDLTIQVLEDAPAMEWALALQDTLLAESRERALGAMQTADASEADRWVSICQEMAAADADCRQVESWLGLRGQAERALQGGRATTALQLADACLGLSASDPLCETVRREARILLAPPPEVPEERPAVIPPSQTGTNPEARDQTTTPTQERTPPPAQARTQVRAGVDSTGIQPSVAAEADTAGPTEPPPPTVDLPALSASSLAIREFRFSDGQFTLGGSFSAIGPGDTSICVASLFEDQDGEPFTDEDGEFALGGQVAVTQSLTPGTTSSLASISHTLPVAQLHLSSGTHRVMATTRIFPGGCENTNPTAPALAEAVTQPICIVRYPAGWNLCRG